MESQLIQNYRRMTTVCFSCLSRDRIFANLCLNCEFNASAATRNMLEFCDQLFIEPQTIQHVLKNIHKTNIKKIAMNMGYKSSISVERSRIVCEIEFSKHSGWFSGSGDNEYLAIVHRAFPLRLRGSAEESRQIKWSERVNASIIPPPFMGELVKPVFDHLIRFPLSDMTDLEQMRNNVLGLPPSDVVMLIRQPILSQPLRLHNNNNTKEKFNSQLIWKGIEIQTELCDAATLSVEDTCPICCDTLDPNTFATTNCGHVLCGECIPSFISNCGDKCCMCRGKVNSFQFSSNSQLIRFMNTKIQVLSK